MLVKAVRRVADGVRVEETSPGSVARPSRRLTLVRSAGLGLALAGTIAIGWRNTHPDEPTRLCTADAIVVDDGSAPYHRDPAQDCAWVDADGHRVELGADGRPLPR